MTLSESQHTSPLCQEKGDGGEANSADDVDVDDDDADYADVAGITHSVDVNDDDADYANVAGITDSVDVDDDPWAVVALVENVPFCLLFRAMLRLGIWLKKSL